MWSRGGSAPTAAEAVLPDNPHAAFSVVRESFTLEVKSDQDQACYLSLSALYRSALSYANRPETFDDVVSGVDYAVLEVPYLAWREQLDAAREMKQVSTPRD